MKTNKIPNRYKRKMAIKQAEYEPKQFSLDPHKYSWNAFCKKCYGRGYTGFEQKSKKYMLCRCASPMGKVIAPTPAKPSEVTS